MKKLFRQEKKEESIKFLQKPKSLKEDLNKLIDYPVPFEKFREEYYGSSAPGEIWYDILLVLHLHREELAKLKKELGRNQT